VIIEAFAKGTPVIASRLGAMVEIVEDGSTGLLFEPGNPSDLAAKVRDIVGTTEQAARMRGAARGSFERRYTVERNYQVLMDIYEGAINRRSQPERAETRRIREELRHHG
jgi:glycosyltransferase involved in cell wall biosynthesis